ncbi:MAG: MSMEG_4193 family putative phosphomutase [Actinomycetota bacterium]|nr:MSMEG_4193 family putative phosphomutase [Actinomycetota bacterium]
MTTVVLVRHGRTTANAAGVLAGWSPGVALDDAGRQQAAALAHRLAAVPLAAVVSSPLERCRQTAAALVEGRAGGLATDVSTDERLGECRYGDWTGKEIKKLAKDPLWRVVQAHPSAVTFPSSDGFPGESMRDMQLRAVDAVRDWNARLGEDAVWVALSHGDVIKAVAADALGVHLDQFQRVVVDPCSMTIINYTPLRPFVVRLNDVGADVSALMPPKRRGRRARRAAGDAVVGGGAGPGT